jgi:hypothetical protein
MRVSKANSVVVEDLKHRVQDAQTSGFRKLERPVAACVTTREQVELASLQKEDMPLINTKNIRGASKKKKEKRMSIQFKHSNTPG